MKTSEKVLTASEKAVEFILTGAHNASQASKPRPQQTP